MYGKIKSVEVVGPPRKQRLVAKFADDTGVTELVWFKGIKWIKDSLNLTDEYIVFGKPNLFNRFINIPHPEIEKVEETNKKINASLQASYNTSEKLKNSFITSRAISKLQMTLLKLVYNKIKETLPEYIISKYNLISLKEALLNIRKHARAESVRLTLSDDDQNFYVTISDNGRGFDLAEVEARPTDKGGAGLANLRARVEASGSRLTIDSGNNGTNVTVILPK